MTATDVFTVVFICTFQRITMGMIASDQSVRISIAEKKKETLLLSCRLQVPSTVLQSLSIG
jgi:hypothetical protein